MIVTTGMVGIRSPVGIERTKFGFGDAPFKSVEIFKVRIIDKSHLSLC